MHVFLHDLRFAGRTLIRERVLGFMVIWLLALGIAGTTAIFSVYNGLFLRPLPFPEPERLVDIDETAPKWNLEYVSVAYIDFSAWRRDNNSFESMATWDGQSFNLSGLGSARRVEGVRATHELTTVLGVQPVIGRAFLPEEARPGGEKVVLLGHGLWQRQFGGDRNILGERLLLDSEPYTIVGVLPPEAAFPENAEVWIPLTDNPEGGGSWYLNAVGRLKMLIRGVSNQIAITLAPNIKKIADNFTEAGSGAENLQKIHFQDCRIRLSRCSISCCSRVPLHQGHCKLQNHL